MPSKNSCLALLLIPFILCSYSYTLRAQCIKNAYTVSGDSIISGGCTINGDLTIVNNGVLEVNMTGAGLDTFVVRGNILLQGNATLWIHADSGATGKLFIVSNTSNAQRTITEQNISKIILENIEFRTQEGNLTAAGSIYMNCYTMDSSQLVVTNAFLDNTTAWLLHNLNNQAKLIATNSQQLPTEIYINDSAYVDVSRNSRVGLWLNFDSTYVLNLPLQTGSNYNWQVGSGYGGVATHWYLNIANSNPGIAIMVHPTAFLIVNGHGTPATGEIHVGMQFANGNDTLSGLQPGLQNTSVDHRVTFNNVQLGPIAWQLYLLYNETLHLRNSTINEIGIAGPGDMAFVDSSVLQLAVLAAIGTNSGLTINNSQIWNQDILAANSSHITLNNCAITGSLLNPADAGSVITMNNCCLYPNPSGCTQNNMVNIATGVPNCNPFRPAGMPTATGSGNLISNGSCITALSQLSEPIILVNIFPNPASAILHVQFNNLQTTQIKILNILGEEILKKQVQNEENTINVSEWPSGIYFIELRSESNSQIKKVIISR